MDKRFRNILVVDDEKVFAETVSRHLRMEGYKVITAYSGLEAIAILGGVSIKAGKDVDLIITDINMPGLNGLKLIKWIHAHVPKMSIIAITGCGAHSNISATLRQGVDRFVMKPLTPCKMLELINQLIVDGLTECGKIDL